MFWLNVLLFAMTIALALVIILPVALIIYGIVKKKRKLVNTTLIVTGIGLVGIFSYRLLFPTQFPYVDMWVKGKTQAEITQKYGEPAIGNSDTKIAYYIGQDNGFFGIMGSNTSYYYYIHFDETGKAYAVTKSAQPGG